MVSWESTQPGIDHVQKMTKIAYNPKSRVNSHKEISKFNRNLKQLLLLDSLRMSIST